MSSGSLVLLALLVAQAPVPAPPAAPARDQQASAPSSTTPEQPSATSDQASGKQNTPPAPAVDITATGVSLDRIQKQVSHPPAITLTQARPVYRVEVFGTSPTIEDILGPDYLKGPVPYGAMTHQEFLDMVTPDEVRGYAAFSNKQGMVVAATSVALQWALQKAMDKVKDAKTEHAKREAQQEVDEALKALQRARRNAGLPD